MVHGKFYLSGSEPDLVYQLRRRVFQADRDENDDMAMYALVSDESGVGAACGRLSIQNDVFTIDYVGVIEPLRRRGYGDLVMRMLLFRALEANAASVVLASPNELIDFFARYGFKTYQLGTMRALRTEIRLEGSCVHGAHNDECDGNCEACALRQDGA